MSIEKTRFTCPDCGGAIEKIEEGRLVQYRCRVGHLYSPETALAIHAEREENTLWTAVVILEEGAELAEEVADRRPDGPDKLREAAASKRKLAEQVRQVAMDLAKHPID